MKFVLIPDSFKGTLSSLRVCEIIESEIKKKFTAEVIKIPVADGGEGSVDAFLAAVGGEKVFLEVTGRGVEKIIVGLGGSATNDGGCGCAAAVGIRFYDRNGKSFVPVGGNLGEIQKIDASGFARALQGIEIVTMCDIDNPLYGKQGAAHDFGPQKGADPDMVEFLDENHRALAEVVARDRGFKE